MVEVDVQCDAILKLPVIYANLVVDEFFSQYIHEYPHDYGGCVDLEPVTFLT